MHISVITCAHNPRRDYLARVTAALDAQTLDKANWEFLLIDNASSHPLANEVDLLWHPNARHVREDELGLTPARIRGIAEASGDVLIFVDDDNVLAPDYLEHAKNIAGDLPFLGAWGGSVVAEFESPPPAWTLGHLERLAVRPVDRDRWGNAHDDWRLTPLGAGLCVRNSVAKTYAKNTITNQFGLKLDRKGKTGLSGGGDSSIALTALELGAGQGVFARLEVTHLIPPLRLEERYLLKLAGAAHFSGVFVEHIHHLPMSPMPSATRFVLQCGRSLVRRGPRAVRFMIAERRGRLAGLSRLPAS
jgi:hypothetical protein